MASAFAENGFSRPYLWLYEHPSAESLDMSRQIGCFMWNHVSLLQYLSKTWHYAIIRIDRYKLRLQFPQKHEKQTMNDVIGVKIST